MLAQSPRTCHHWGVASRELVKVPGFAGFVAVVAARSNTCNCAQE